MSSLPLHLAVPHLGHGGQEVAGGLLEGAQEGDAQGPRAEALLHALVGQGGLPLLFALGQRHVQRLGAEDAPVHLGHGLCCLFWRGKTHKAKPFAVATLCHHLKARQDKGCWEGEGRLLGPVPPPPPGPSLARSWPRRNMLSGVYWHPRIH